MNFGELLGELREGILHDHSQQIAGSGDDQLWSDERLTLYINQAQDRFARETFSIRDSTSAATEVTLVTGQTVYDLHPAVFAVVSGRFDDQRFDLSRAGHSILDAYRSPDWMPFDPSYISNYPPGQPIAFSTDESVGAGGVIQLRVWPEPDSASAGKKLRLRVVRGPINPFTLDDLDALPELPPQHHMEMLDWAAYLALRGADIDEGAPDRALEFKSVFEDNVKRAKRLSARKLFAPKGWRFGGGGWGSWERH